MKKIFFIILFFTIFSCREESVLPYYEVVPVVEVTNAKFDDVEAVRLNISVVVDGLSTTQSWDIAFKGVRRGCNLIKWAGNPIEYIEGTELVLETSVLYDLGDGPGFTLLDNLSSNNLIKLATWIRSYFEVRDKNNPSDRFVGIEAENNPSDELWQVPNVYWTVGDFINVPGNVASPSTNARIASGIEELKECDCVWTKVE